MRAQNIESSFTNIKSRDFRFVSITKVVVVDLNNFQVGDYASHFEVINVIPTFYTRLIN